MIVNVKPFALTSYQKVGIIQLPIAAFRCIAANDIDTIANAGGVVAKDSAPIFERVNGAADKAQRLRWVAGNVTQITAPSFAYPYDLNDAQPVYIKALAQMSGATDTPAITATYFEGVGDTNAGGSMGSVTSALTTLSVTIAAADIAAYPNFAAIGLTPAAHATDALYLYAVWLEYTRR